MDVLILELQQEHKKLNAALQAVLDIGVASKKGQAALLALREPLKLHLRKEDEHIYPALRIKAMQDPEVARSVNPFLAEMESISQFTNDFFQRLEKDGGGIEFARDAGRLIGKIRNRMHQAEFVIYTQYEKLLAIAA